MLLLWSFTVVLDLKNLPKIGAGVIFLKTGRVFSYKGTINYYVSQNVQQFGPSFFFVQTCSILVAPSPLSNVQSLTSAPLTFTTTPYKSRKVCKFIVLLPVVISPCKYPKKCTLSVR